jgi:hypothetical protein
VVEKKGKKEKNAKQNGIVKIARKQHAKEGDNNIL